MEEPFVLHPGEFVLGTTFEKVSLSNKVVARLEGKSSLGRIGLLIHSTAGFCRSWVYRLLDTRTFKCSKFTNKNLSRNENRTNFFLLSQFTFRI